VRQQAAAGAVPLPVSAAGDDAGGDDGED